MKKQLLATLICIKSYGNTAFLTKIDDLYRMRKNTIDKVYYWVITAI